MHSYNANMFVGTWKMRRRVTITALFATECQRYTNICDKQCLIVIAMYSRYSVGSTDPPGPDNPRRIIYLT